MADKKDDDLHSEGLRIYDAAVERESENRTRYSEDVRFARLSEQWPDGVRKQRATDGRPCLTINKLPAFIRQVVNDARQNTPQIKFHPVGDGSDQWTAKVLDGLVRNIEVQSNADVAYDTAIENAVTGGFGFFRITTDYTADDSFDQDIRIERIPNSLSVVPDAHCMDADSANWNDCFVTETYSLDAFKAKWPKADVSSFEGDGRSQCAPNWLDGDDVMVAEWWKRREVDKVLLKLSNGDVMYQEQFDAIAELLELDGITVIDQRPVRAMKVTQHIMTGSEIIETNEWAGKYIPVVPVYGDEVVIDGKRHLKSMIHDAKDAQMSYNFWRSTATEVAGQAPKSPWIGATGSFASDPNWATSNTVNHPYLEYDPVEGMPPPQRIPFTGPDAASMQEAMNASDDMKSVMGLYDASLGAQSNETSGRAILARQREGDVSTFNFTDNQNRAIRHAGRILADLIPKVYSVERVIRVIHEDDTNENVKINGPTDPIKAQQQAMQGQQGMTPEQQAIAQIYDLTAGKYDVTCESGPSFTTKRQEAAMQMTEFMRAVPGAGQVMGDLLAKNLDWPGADEIAERLKLLLPPQAQGQNPQLMQAQQQMQQMQGLIQQLQQQLADEKRDRSIEERKLDIDGHKADTDRLKALGVTLMPEVAASMGLQVVQSAAQALNGPDITPGGQQQPTPANAGMPPEQPQPAMPPPDMGGAIQQ